MNLPNAISLARLIAVPFMIYLLLRQEYTAAFWLFVAAAASDGIDGAIAKRFDMVSRLGTYLDPVADKALLTATYLVLGQQGEIAMLVVILVVFRDAMIVGGFVLQSIYRGNHVLPEPIFVSKINTVVQLFLAAVVLMELGLGWDSMWVRGVTVYVVGVTTVVSGGLYLVAWARHMGGIENGK